ncbi:hypothetical protein [Parasitella parasitica]|uniref:CCHC-type domain-containing protein n=1 Tax=Parasitella parasitica TaxID=35722 RepID=A0A0B7N674_9FUNG|nr:hypothetical protein [Parasitella parasitica]
MPESISQSDPSSSRSEMPEEPTAAEENAVICKWCNRLGHQRLSDRDCAARIRSTSNVVVCPSCGKEGHQRRSHSDCDNNPNNQASISIDAEEAEENVNTDTVNSSAETVAPKIHTFNTPRVVHSACGREGHRQRTHIDCEHNLSRCSNQLSIARDPSVPEVDRNELGEMSFNCEACGAHMWIEDRKTPYCNLKFQKVVNRKK